MKTSLSHTLCIEKLLIVNVEKSEFNINGNISFKVACAHEMFWKNVSLYLSCCLDPRLTLKLLDRFRLNFNKTWSLGQNIWKVDFKSDKNSILVENQNVFSNLLVCILKQYGSGIHREHNLKIGVKVHNNTTTIVLT